MFTLRKQLIHANVQLGSRLIPDHSIHKSCNSHHPTQQNMEISDQTVQKIERFAENRQVAERESAREPLSDTALHAYTRRLDATLKGLQEQVKRQENDLIKVHYKSSTIENILAKHDSSCESLTPLNSQNRALTHGPAFRKPDGPRKHTIQSSNLNMSFQQQIQCCPHFSP
jgi:hypothetical protein